jgi:hypothetical protein
MKHFNSIRKNLLFGISLALVLSFSACDLLSEDDDSGSTSGIAAITGQWDRNDMVVEINSNGGVIVEVRSGGWLTGLNNGVFSLGDRKFRNIQRIDDNEWSMEELYLGLQNGVPVESRYSDNGKIVLSADGNTITITSDSPYTGNPSAPINYRRVN